MPRCTALEENAARFQSTIGCFHHLGQPCPSRMHRHPRPAKALIHWTEAGRCEVKTKTRVLRLRRHESRQFASLTLSFPNQSPYAMRHNLRHCYMVRPDWLNAADFGIAWSVFDSTCLQSHLDHVVLKSSLSVAAADGSRKPPQIRHLARYHRVQSRRELTSNLATSPRCLLLHCFCYCE